MQHKKIEFGDTVRKKMDGGDEVLMRVAKIEGDHAICKWTDAKGERHTEKFRLEELESQKLPVNRTSPKSEPHE